MTTSPLSRSDFPVRTYGLDLDVIGRSSGLIADDNLLVTPLAQFRSRGIELVWQTDLLAADFHRPRAFAYKSLEKIHGRCSHETGHEDVGWMIVNDFRAIAL